MNSIIEHPIVTEQAMNEMDFKNKLLFLVDIDATKPEVREESAGPVRRLRRRREHAGDPAGR